MYDYHSSWPKTSATMNYVLPRSDLLLSDSDRNSNSNSNSNSITVVVIVIVNSFAGPWVLCLFALSFSFDHSWAQQHNYLKPLDFKVIHSAPYWGTRFAGLIFGQWVDIEDDNMDSADRLPCRVVSCVVCYVSCAMCHIVSRHVASCHLNRAI